MTGRARRDLVNNRESEERLVNDRESEERLGQWQAWSITGRARRDLVDDRESERLGSMTGLINNRES
jgi:hypothetical protein